MATITSSPYDDDQRWDDQPDRFHQPEPSDDGSVREPGRPCGVERDLPGVRGAEPPEFPSPEDPPTARASREDRGVGVGSSETPFVRR